MLDIQFIRDNAELVKQKSQQKGYEVDIDKLLRVDEQRRITLRQIEQNREKINTETAKFKNQPPTEQQRENIKLIKDENRRLEHALEPDDKEYWELLKAVPNIPLDDVPFGASEQDNEVAKEVGEKRHFTFKPNTHWQLAEGQGLIDKERAAKVVGARFAYIKDGLVELQFAIIQFVMHALGDENVLKKIITENNLKLSTKPFRPVLPPHMLKTEVYEAMDRLEPRDDRYKVGLDQDDLWLQGSAEHTLGPMYMNEILDEGALPLRYLGYATSFRREAGSYGKDTEGIVRMHQFDKLEMEVFSTAATGKDEHLLLIALQEYLMQQLKIPYRVVMKCTADIGKPNARGVDIESWMPGENRYLETHTADYMTDYQARRLKTRTRGKEGKTELIHTNDATAFALGRIIAAIIENHQQADGSVTIPEALRPFIGDKEKI